MRLMDFACAAWIAIALLQGAAQAQPPDSGVRPGDDFYRYANNTWLKTTTTPPGRAAYDTRAMLNDQAAGQVRDLIADAAREGAAGHANRVGDYYAAWLDVAAIEAKGLKPLSGDLAAIAAIGDRRALSAYLGGALRLDDGSDTQVDGIFGVWIHQGFHDGGHYAAHLAQGGLGLPGAGDYQSADAAHRDLYRAHVSAILKLAGFDQTDTRAARVLALETAIAATHASRADTDDVAKTDNPWRRVDFAAKAPGMDWDAYFNAAGLGGQDAFVVWQPGAVTGTSALIGAQPIAAWQDYLAFHLIEHFAAVLPKTFRDEDAAFAGHPPTEPDRAAEAIDATNAALGLDVGRLYVARYFPPQAKAAAVAMAENIRTAFRPRITALTWMSPAMRDMALAKLATLKLGIGYPDSWPDYSGLVIKRDDALGNLRRAEAFAYVHELAKLKHPVDPAEWTALLPQKPGAIIYFSPNTEQFSAALLQPPFFDATGDAATNYGSAGAGMAHEISHSFDELGSLYDAQGNLAKWWTADDLARYQAASAPLAAQFDTYCLKPDLCVKGKQVLGENIADLAGLLAAHDAYVLSLNGKPDTVKDGLTGDQRFFLSFARRWRKLQTDAALAQQVATDIHAPGEFRADTVRNLDDWLKAYDVKPGDRLYLAPDKRVRIW